MKKVAILILASGMLSPAVSSLVAQVSTNSSGQNITQQDPDRRGLRREQRRKLLELLGLNPKDLKGLSAEDRRAKMKAAAEPKITALEGKKANGTITTEEQKDLVLLQKFINHTPKAKSDT